MKNLKVSMKLLVAFGTVLILLVAVIVIAFMGLTVVGGGLETFYTGPFRNVEYSLTLGSNVHESAKNMLHACVTKDSSETKSRLDMADENLSSMSAIVTQLKANFVGDQSLITSVESDLNTLVSQFNELEALCIANNVDGAFAIYSDQMQPLLASINTNLNYIQDTSNERAATTYNSGMTTEHGMIIFMIVVGLISIAAGIIMALGISRMLTRCIMELRNAALKMAEGDFDAPLTYHSKDELGELSHGMRMMTENIKLVIEDVGMVVGAMANGDFTVGTKVEERYVGVFESLKNSIRKMRMGLSSTLTQIDQSADQVASGSDQVSSGSQALSQGATEQASSVEELAATIAEISSHVKTTADNAMQARDQTNMAGEEIASCNKQMQEMISAMKDISDNSQEIGKIIKTIEDIAFQTNILALNAAVEAARAGAAGKGFAVVADEVRNLASKSAEASKNTSVLIETAIHSVDKGMQIADGTASSLSNVVTAAAETAEIVEKISVAANEQASSIAQITQGIDQISGVVQTNSATAEESAAASEELSGQSQMLKSLVGRFKLHRGGNSAGDMAMMSSPASTSAPALTSASGRVSSVSDANLY